MKTTSCFFLCSALRLSRLWISINENQLILSDDWMMNRVCTDNQCVGGCVAAQLSLCTFVPYMYLSGEIEWRVKPGGMSVLE